MSETSEELQDINISGSSRQVCETLSVEATMRRCHTSLLNLLRQRLRVDEDAADIAQEAYLRMLQYDGSNKVYSPSSLLFQIATNIARDQWRREKARQVTEYVPIDGMEIASCLPDVDREVAASSDLEIVYDAIEHLPPKCRHVFLLSRVEYMTYPQIAAHCSISVKMVEKHISHALAVCMKKLGSASDVS